MSKKKELEIAAIKNYLAPFLNLHKQFPLLPGAQTLRGQAAFIGIDEKELSDLRNGYAKTAKKAALDMLNDDVVLEYVDNIPFQTTDKIMVIGDSITDDAQGWFEIFSNLLAIGVDDAEFKFINTAVYNSTSLDALRRVDRDLGLNSPNWVIVALGSHDSQKLHGIGDHRTLVSIAEFWENISTIESMVGEITTNPIIWITPPPVIAELMLDMPLFDGVVDNKELSQFREVISGKNGYVVDPHGIRMGNPAQAWNYLPDGFHPSTAGHMETVKFLLKTLSQKESTPTND
jgi:lysophospholipase L1-like esterase